MNNVNTPYDDVFRTLLTDCSHLILPVLNEVFGESYLGTETIILKNNEHFLFHAGSLQDKVITDSSFLVFKDGTPKSYHVECQSTPDGTMAIRMFEYDSQIALQDSAFECGILTVNFPHSAILYLRHTSNTPSQFTLVINTPGGQLSYSIPILKVKTYSMDAIFEKHLYFLIPFYIFTYESQLKSIENDAARLDALCKEYAIIRTRLETLTLQGNFSEYTLKTICDMSDKVISNLAHKYEKIKKEVTTVMGGKVLEYEAKTIYREGIKEGISQGLSQGIIALVDSLKELGCSTDIIHAKIKQKFNLSEEEAKTYIE